MRLSPWASRLVRDYQQAEEARRASDLSAEAFAVAFVLKREGIAEAEPAARQVADAFEQHPHWQTSADQERGVRLALYKALIAAKVAPAGLTEFTERIITMLRRAADRS